MIDMKEVVKAIKQRIKEQQRKRYAHEDANNSRAAELAEFHENGLQEALDILQGKTKPVKARPARPKAAKPKKPNPHVWKTAAGKEIPIKEMSDSHLYHTIRLLRRTADSKVHAFTLMPNTFQGEMASESFDQAQDRALEEPEEVAEEYLQSIPQYEHLVKEAARRGLNV